MAADYLLRALNLNVSYGRAQALYDVTIEVGAGEIVALVGRNGAGKSTTLKALCGLQSSQSGEILIAGQAVTGWAVHEIARKGVAFVPEDRQVFGRLTASENLALAQIAKGARRFSLGDVYDLFPQLAGKRRTLAENLSGGEQQMLVIARALLTSPKVMLLDEPTEGLAPRMVESVIQALQGINRAGVGMIIVEQNFRLTGVLAARQYLLDGGKMIWSGTSAELAARRAEVERLLLA